MTNPKTDWTEAEHERLIAMLQDGQSYRQISDALHRSRSSIAGKILREQRIREATPKRYRRSDAVGRKSLKRIANGAPKPPAPPQDPPPMPPPSPPNPPPQPNALADEPKRPRSKMKALADLKPGECKWPGEWTGDLIGGFPFCANAVAEPAAPYCRYHMRLALTARRDSDPVRRPALVTL